MDSSRYGCMTPLGEIFTLEEKQRALDITAEGHYEPYLAHQMLVSEARARAASFTGVLHHWQDLKARKTNTWNLHNGVSLTRNSLVNSVEQQNRPFLNVQVDKDLIARHNSIWSEKIGNSLYRLIAIKDFKQYYRS